MVPLVDVLVPMDRLRAVLEAMPQQGQTRITFEGLRNSSLIALRTDDVEAAASPAAPCAASELACAAAAATAACIVYHYVQLGHVWSVTKDRRDRLYYLSSVLETLDWIQGHAMVQEKEDEEMDDVVEAVGDSVAPRVRPGAPATIVSRRCNRGTETFNDDLTSD
jgi:hypothetical protein